MNHLVSSAFRVKRVALTAGVLTPQYAPKTASSVSIGNATSGDLEVHTHEDGSEYLIVASGYERLVPVDKPIFIIDTIALWLKATATGTVVLVWY